MTPTETTVQVLLEAAGLSVSPAEMSELVDVYPAHRSALDALYAVPMDKEEEPQTVFSPLP
jgi:hypothetical protein